MTTLDEPAKGDRITYYVPAAAAKRGESSMFRFGIATGKVRRDGRIQVEHGGHYGPATRVWVDPSHVHERVPAP